MTLIVFALLVGLALGTVLKGALKIALTVVLACAAVFFTCNALHIDWHSLVDTASTEAHEQFERVQPTRAPKPIPPGLREAKRWM